MTAKIWHDHAVEIRGDHIQVFWDGRKVIDHRDGTFLEADSVTYFDDLAATPLSPRDLCGEEGYPW